ncbi:MAG: hypothetical protein ABJG47_02980 [Ekhidna sp.]
MNNKITNYFLSLFMLFLLVSCNPDQKLIEENERLKADNLALTLEAESHKEKAIDAAAAAQRAQQLAQESEKLARAHAEQAGEELKKVKKQLDNCK